MNPHNKVVSITAGYVAWTDKLTAKDTLLFGLKSEEVSKMLEADLSIPKGFAVSSHAYSEFISENNFTNKIKHLISSANYSDPSSVKQVSANIKSLFKKGNVSASVIKEIVSAYKKLGSFLEDAYVTVSPSPTHNHFPMDSDTNRVKGDAALLDTIKDRWSVIFSPMAIFKLKEDIFNKSPGVSVIVQKVYHGAQTGSINTQTSDISSELNVSDDLKLKLIETARKINKHYYFPQIVNWIFTNDSVFITSVRPITHDTENISKNSASVSGLGANSRIISGTALVIKSENDLSKLNSGSIVISKDLSNDLIEKTHSAKAIVTESNASKLQILNIKVPTVFNAENAASIFKTGDVITVNSIKGLVHKGGAMDTVIKTNLINSQGKTATKLFAELNSAKELSSISLDKLDGVIFCPDQIIKGIGIHPKKLIKEDSGHILSSAIENELAQISEIIKDKFIFFKLTSFTSLDYSTFKGSGEFETLDLNPHLGFRGAIRHIHQTDALELELSALKKIFKKGQNYLGIIIPFLRNPSELKIITEILKKHGLVRSAKFRIWMMAQTPSNILLLDEYINTGIDGVTLDPISLYSLLNGIDKDNFELNSIYKGVDDALNQIILKAIETSQKSNIFTSLDQTQGVNPELLREAVRKGVNSVTVSANQIDYTKRFLVQSEKELLRR